MSSKSKNITWSISSFSRGEREKIIGQKGCVIWFTGLSGSGKSTIALALERKLLKLGKISYVLDGDNIRHGLSSDLGFSIAERKENIRRIGEAAALFADAGIIVITSFISPLENGREAARASTGNDRFFEIFLDVPLEVCEGRDPKGLYKKARNGEIDNFTGISSPYEIPKNSQLIINTASLTVDESVDLVLSLLQDNSII